MKKSRNRIIVFVVALVLLITNTGVLYALPGYEPGLRGEASTTKKGDYAYQEVVFLTGQPVLLSGTAKISEDTNGAKTTITYTLTNDLKKATLARKVVYSNTNKVNTLGNQTTQSSAVDVGFSEVVTIGTEVFTLTDYMFSRSGITDDRNIIKYNVASWNGRKIYDRNSGKGQVIVDIDATQNGYSNYWSTTDTAVIKNTITYKTYVKGSTTNFEEAYGTAEYAISYSKVKTMEYQNNLPTDISFKGGYIIKEGEENIDSYKYDLPVITNWVAAITRNIGKNSLKVVTVPTQQRLFVPYIKDVPASFYTIDEIRKAASMDMIGVEGNNYFRPYSFISRGDFAKAIMNASQLKKENPKVKRASYDIKFDDVDTENPNYAYIYDAVKAGIINGTGKYTFSPESYMSKAEAASIIIRAMGLEESSDESATTTSFADDKDIPNWAKKSINIARKMGIITANGNNEIEPNKLMTRSQCAVMLNRFIEYLQYDIRMEYREKIINYGR